jgi:hypothetical protein
VCPIVSNENKIRLNDGGGCKYDINGGSKDFTKVVGKDMVIEKPEKAARDTLMVYTRCRSHGKVSI